MLCVAVLGQGFRRAFFAHRRPCAFLVTDFYGDCFSPGGVDYITKMMSTALDRSDQLIYSVRHFWISRDSPVLTTGVVPNSAGYSGSEATGPRGLCRSTGGLVWSSLDCPSTRGDGGGVFPHVRRRGPC